MKYRLRLFSGLQARITISYVWVTFIAVLLLEMLVFILVATPVFDGQGITARIKAIARSYALMVESGNRTSGLDPHFTFQSGATTTGYGKIQENDLTVPYITTLQQKDVQFALLIAPDGRIFASSYPARYPVGGRADTLLAGNQKGVMVKALSGPAATSLDTTSSGRIASASQAVMQDNRVIGAIYVQAPVTAFDRTSLLSLATSLLGSGILLLLVTVPVGTLFGIITTRNLVKRVRRLVTATTAFADGNYGERVRVTRSDEVGQLELQFNRMAGELVASIGRREELAKQNARLSERSRISRELHDAISQELFSLSMLAGGLQAALPEHSPLQTQVATLEQTTTNMIREMRTLLLELRPTQLEQSGLKKALEECAAAYSTRLGITISTSILSITACAMVEHALLRIVQEALANSARHANASIITIALTSGIDTVELTITDNGRGFEPDKCQERYGLGLRLMQERVSELHGVFILHSAPGQGTRIQVSLPMEQERDSRFNRG